MLRRRASWQSRPPRLQRCALVALNFVNHGDGETRPKMCHLQPQNQGEASSAMWGCMRVLLAGAEQGRLHASRAGSASQRHACARISYHRCSRKSSPPQSFLSQPSPGLKAVLTSKAASQRLRLLTVVQDSRRKAQQELAEARSSEHATQQRGTALTKEVANLKSQVR